MKYTKVNFTNVLFTGLMFLAVYPVSADTFKAKLAWSGRVALTPLVKGYVSEVNVYPGDRVKKGEVLMRLFPGAFQARIDQFSALLKSNKSDLDEAKRELNRSKELYERTLLSDHDLQIDKNAYVLASAKHKATLAQLENARINLQYSITRAPFNARVIQRDAEMGQSVFPDIQPKPSIVIAEDQAMLALAWLTEDQATRISGLNQTVTIRINKTIHKGTILFIGLEPKSNNEQLYALVVKFNIDSQQYKAGMSAEVIVDDL